MKALVLHELTGIDGLKLEHDWPEPALKPGTVLIDVATAALNFPDLLILKGLYQFKPPLPSIPGMELAGTIAAVGEGVARWKVGDRVIAYAPGAAAERVVVPQDRLLPLPASLDFESGCGVSVTYFTTYHAYKQRAQLAAGETVLVLGAASGVGTTAVELAKQMGATVIAAASTPAKLEVARKLGADHLIDYSTQDLRERIKDITGGKGVDVVYDAVGGPYAEPAVRSLAWKGRYLVVGFAAGDIPKIPMNLLLLKGASLVGVFFGSFAEREPQAQQQNVRELWALFEAGKLKPVVGAVHPLAEYAEAFRSMEQRRAVGKVVLRIR
ncbi:MAG: NADPH:quinone oxidoreductase family protein [Gammaproteobacteria bacterium]|nr:NADPH:quinone oxidoreductase family protein [Gammaproteobacteria bacterium]